MVQNALVYFVVRFIVRQVGIAGQAVKWAEVKTQWDQFVTDHVPGVFLDAEAVSAVNAVLDGTEALLSDTKDLTDLLTKAASQDYVGAEVALMDLLKTTVGGKLASILAA